jgi:hypothetical protein
MSGIPRSEWGNQAQWAITAPLLFASIAGVPWALSAVLALCSLTTIYYAAMLRSVSAYRVQVRMGFMLIAGTALLPGMQWILWIPAVGTSAQVIVGYCPMARILDLMPWNRSEPLRIMSTIEVVMRRPGNEGLFSIR